MRHFGAQRMPLRPGVALAAASMLLAAPLAAQTPLPIDAKKLIPHRDSMVVLVNDQPMGSSVWGLAEERRRPSDPRADRHRHGHAAGDHGRADKAERRTEQVSQTGDGRRDAGKHRDHATPGSASPGSVQAVTAEGPNAFAVDTTCRPGTVDDNSLQALLPALPWAEGAAWNFRMYSAGSNAVSVMALWVVGTQTAMVPAGAFEAYRVGLTGGATDVDFLILKRTPHTVLKIEMTRRPRPIRAGLGRGALSAQSVSRPRERRRLVTAASAGSIPASASGVS